MPIVAIYKNSNPLTWKNYVWFANQAFHVLAKAITATMQPSPTLYSHPRVCRSHARHEKRCCIGLTWTISFCHMATFDDQSALFCFSQKILFVTPISVLCGFNTSPLGKCYGLDIP